MIVFSISGKAGAGKDTLANILIDEMAKDGIRAKRLSFATPIKDICEKLFRWDRTRLESDIFYKEGGLGGWVPRNQPGANPISMDRSSGIDLTYTELDMDEACMAFGMSRRQIMQRIGTECFRDNFNKNFWIIMMQLAMKWGDYSDVDVGIIPDARFLNELGFAKSSGGLTIHVSRSGDEVMTQHGNHASEQEWQSWPEPWDVDIQNNPAHGMDNLRSMAVRAVYTSIVQNCLRRFSLQSQFGLIRRSVFGGQNSPETQTSPEKPVSKPSPFRIPVIDPEDRFAVGLGVLRTSSFKD